MSDAYGLALSDACSGYEALKPPTRMTVAEGARANLIIQQTGAPRTKWSAEETPYMTAPMNKLASRKHEAVVFVGPARTGKTAGLLLGWMSHAVVNDPGDMLLIQMSKDKAREFSKTDVDRAIRYSPNVQAKKSERTTDSNTFDTMFRHGMWLRIAWPTVSNVSGSTYRYVGITDIDRIENAENVDGEGPLFDLGKKRTTSFMSRGMTLVESSPGKPFENPKWKPATPHEAPPTKGILSLYNRSDRHRFYWQCLDCHEHFEAAPGLQLFHRLPDAKQLLEEVRTANIASMAKHMGRVSCPHCGSEPEARWKKTLNAGGLWLPDGCKIDKDGEITGEPLVSSIAGYWLGGVAATYQSWTSIVEQYLLGLAEYARTGSEEKLKQTTNTDQGMPYMPRHLVEVRDTTTSPRERAEVGLQRYVAPEETRAVTVSVDVQGGQNARFDVQVHAVGPLGEQWVIDRFAIKDSMREGTMPGEFAPIDPASFPEDWDVLTEKILRATWRTPISNLEIRALGVVVDSGGEAGRPQTESAKSKKKTSVPHEEKSGVTHNAYAWFRRARAEGYGARVYLYKGGSNKEAPEMRDTMVGKIGTKGKDDVPLLLCNTNKLSDAVDAGLRRPTPGAGYIHFPAPKHPETNPEGWVTQAFFDELEAEVRGLDGTWTKIRARNETFDHCRMQRALMLRLGIYRVDNWDVVPARLAPLAKNSMTVTREDRKALQANTPTRPEVARPTPPPVVAPRRRARRSSMAAL
ncbi:terminase gpA endonuclease subunit [Comamonas antarctica]|uniref:terminase gpA endonuclease subunit n=1 Tax=Comamonas antarctica TaxID=2743470 RepID=UPI0028E30473|nr:terminase gpA endonuclease subunit [Comamonas antarctica]